MSILSLLSNQVLGICIPFFQHFNTFSYLLLFFPHIPSFIFTFHIIFTFRYIEVIIPTLQEHCFLCVVLLYVCALYIFTSSLSLLPFFFYLFSFSLSFPVLPYLPSLPEWMLVFRGKEGLGEWADEKRDTRKRRTAHSLMFRGRTDCVPRERGRVMGQLALRNWIRTAGEQRSQPRKQVTADPKSPRRELIGKGGKLNYTDRKNRGESEQVGITPSQIEYDC